MTDEYEDFKRTFFVTENEEDCVLKSYDEIEKLQRTLLLYDISEALRENL